MVGLSAKLLIIFSVALSVVCNPASGLLDGADHTNVEENQNQRKLYWQRRRYGKGGGKGGSKGGGKGSGKGGPSKSSGGRRDYDYNVPHYGYDDDFLATDSEYGYEPSTHTLIYGQCLPYRGDLSQDGYISSSSDDLWRTRHRNLRGDEAGPKTNTERQLKGKGSYSSSKSKGYKGKGKGKGKGGDRPGRGKGCV